MTVDLRITGGTAATPRGVERADVLVSDGVIAGVVSPGAEEGDAFCTVNAHGLHVLPGMVYVHVHTREPGYTPGPCYDGRVRETAGWPFPATTQREIVSMPAALLLA
ncbi:MAG TPA: hypothetical protein VF898_08500 [Chloroflexota bacterium]